MTKTEHQSAIALQMANQNMNLLLGELAAKCAEIDVLNAEIADLKAQLSPKPEAKSATD